MLNEEQLKIIDKYVEEKYYDKEKLVKYLNMHEIVGNEIFQYCDKKAKEYMRGGHTYASSLDKDGFVPVGVDRFVRRIPFYFYVADSSKGKLGDIEVLLLEISERDKIEPEKLEYVYHNLEWAL